eukprot:CAMPEP_0195528772 /NCGR_PEP_ID=MMETSP0794_2-20130614/31065_1 /TAXON_ID=515487 /ORGANISM="Stephanopyxis turris, Strain CCMP 815" /LENGTH=419 /DNA_ID=CAMNT_0040659961 /DNA_START=113 /DNA_END=1372 /DNA_ORIENTATION=+
MERLLPGSSTAISGLVAMRMIPNILFASLGGVIADSFDRRMAMITLDFIGAFVVLFYLVALYVESASMLFAVSFARGTIAALYEPITRSIVPQLLPDEQDLQRSVVLSGIAWSSMLISGGVVAGYVGAYLGIEACYILDSFSYCVSALLMWNVWGKFNVAAGEAPIEKELENVGFSICETTTTIFSLFLLFKPILKFLFKMLELVKYVWVCSFGILLVMKSSGSFTWGAADVVNVSFTQVEGDEKASSERLGLLYSSVGLGCLLGPLVANYFTDIKEPETLQLACILALALMVVGWFGIALVGSFHWICFFTSVRSFGSAIIWINSTLLLQKLVPKKILGRVLGLDFGFAMTCETIAAFIAGLLEDAKYTNRDISLSACVAGAILTLFWIINHEMERGVANKSNIESSDNEEEYEVTIT